MEQDRYRMTLDRIKPWIVGIVREGIPYGYANQRTEPGYLLKDGTVLLESEKDENGFYIGGAGMDGIYLRTGAQYEPVRDDAGHITGFRKMSRYLAQFNGEEQKIIFQYAMNTQDHLIEDLTGAIGVLKHAPQLYAQFTGVVEKLKQIPPCDCERLMADIRAAYKGRLAQSILERTKAAKKRKGSVER